MNKKDIIRLCSVDDLRSCDQTDCYQVQQYWSKLIATLILSYYFWSQFTKWDHHVSWTKV